MVTITTEREAVLVAANDYSRPATPDVKITEALQPVSAPVNIEFRHPAAQGPSPLHGVAEALSSLSSDLAAWGAKQQQQQKEEDLARGEALFYEGTQGGYAKGVADGIIPADKSPWVARGYKRAQGISAGISLDSYLGGEFEQWGDKTNPDTAAFDTWFSNTVKGRIKTEDGQVLIGLMPYLRAAQQKYHSKWEASVTKNTENTTIASYGAAVASTIDDAVSDAQQDGTTLDLERLGANIDALRDHGKGIGLRNDQVDKLVADTIAVKALTTRDPSLLALYDRKSASGPKRGDTPYGMQMRKEATDHLTKMWKTEASEERLRQEREDKLAANNAERQIVDQFLKDPKAPISEELLGPVLKVHPEFKIKLLDWQKKVADGLVVDDPVALSHLHGDILAGRAGFDEIMAAREAGQLQTPDAMKQALSFLDQVQRYNQKPDRILESVSAKNTISQIKQLGAMPGMVKNFFGETAMTPQGLQALSDFSVGAMKWDMEHPNATPVEKQQFLDKFGAGILQHFRPVPGNDRLRLYDRPAEAAAGNSAVAITPSAQVLQRTGQPPAPTQPTTSRPPGRLEPGNIDLHARPSAVRSISVGVDGGKTILIPTVDPFGRVLSNEQAIQLWRQTGQHLGIFDTEQNANAYAQSLHNAQPQEYLPKAGQPQAPQPPVQPQVPSTPNQATQGTGQPISTSVPQQGATNPLYRAMSPEQRNAIEGLAKRKGMSVDDFLGGVKLPDKRSDAGGGGGLPFAVITPASLIETARSAASRLGLSGVISQQQPQSLQASTETNPVINSARVNRIRSSAVGPVLQQVAQQMGFDPDKLMAIASIESGGKPTASTGSYHGLFQLSQAEFAKYGDGGNIYDPQANAIAAVRSLQDKSARFSREFGHEPSATELYLMHQQGEAGLRAHEQRPDAPAWTNMARTGEGRRKGERWAKLAIWGNVPTDMRHYFGSVNNITSRQFLAVWTSKILGVGYAEALAMNGGGGDGGDLRHEAGGNLEDEA